MSLYRNYDSRAAGGVVKNAFPNVHPVPWTPTQRNVRANPNIPSQPQRVQPQERGTYFPTSASGGGTLAVAMSSGCSSCGGCSGCGQSMASPDSGMTASSIATQHSFPTATSTPPEVVANKMRSSRGTALLRTSRVTPAKGTATPTRLRAASRGFLGR